MKDNQAIMNQLRESANHNELVVVIGTGVSMSLTNGRIPALSWTGLIRDGFSYGVKKGLIKPDQAKSWEPQLTSSDMDDLLCAAEFVGRKLNAPQGDLYARWIENLSKHLKPENEKMGNAVLLFQEAGIPICTLNFDLLLEQVTGLDGITMNETAKVTSWMRHETEGILHLHGACNIPESCILGIRDYESTIRNEVRDLIQRSLTSFRRLLFIGCGGTFADPNFSALIKWLRKTMGTATLEHYALVSTNEVAACHAYPSWHGFIEPVGYGKNQSDLPQFLVKNFPIINLKSKDQKSDSGKFVLDSLSHAKVIDDYLTYVIKDCGQMTIEGVRADMEIGQQKFDIERMFVPLEVVECPPDIPEDDPRHDERLRKWQEKHGKSFRFGKVLEKHERIALLALPGGGKTLLIKRIAVAYADRNRRNDSKDFLPDFSLIPVLIRCREWREYIQSPILTILQKLPEISGNIRLSGLVDVLIPLFQDGKILLLVDGLDEIHNDAHRTIFVEHLEVFLEEYQKTRLIVTSREAGFSLVAPCLSRFCKSWRLAPLREKAIEALCNHWQQLMVGNTPQALAEGQELAQYLMRNDSLRRLAENPLLLTMLLVVKQGSGHLPPDRVSLYARAVDVLLDTWNIKGHDPLSPKEAVPQLAFVALQMMKAGTQTVTQKELLALLEDARENVPQIHRYAKDSPYDFLKRVELRSSLLVEAGHKIEAGMIVPFYQFRHLTFQEYLAAVAAVEGIYNEYNKTDSVITPLLPYLTAEEWKEVIPMAAVLARKQAEPLVSALVAKSILLRDQIIIEMDKPHKNMDVRRTMSFIKPNSGSHAPMSRLVQCLIEEAEAAPETLASALQLSVFFADSFDPGDELDTLCQGPYGSELLHQAWLLYVSMKHVNKIHLLQTYAQLSAVLWGKNEDTSELEKLLNSSKEEEIVRGMFACVGLLWDAELSDNDPSLKIISKFAPEIERNLITNNPVLQLAGIFALTIIWNLTIPFPNKITQPSVMILDHLLVQRLHNTDNEIVSWSKLSFAMQMMLPRNKWKPKLNPSELILIRESLEKADNLLSENDDFESIGDFMIAYHSGIVYSDDVLIGYLTKYKEINRNSYVIEGVNFMLRQLNILE